MHLSGVLGNLLNNTGSITMEIARIEGATRVLGQSQGYRGLPVRDEPYWDPAQKVPVMSMVTAWTPSHEELMKLIQGANIHVRILGKDHYPIMLEVGEVPK
jgi:hypothetical protein